MVIGFMPMVAGERGNGAEAKEQKTAADGEQTDGGGAHAADDGAGGTGKHDQQRGDGHGDLFPFEAIEPARKANNENNRSRD